MPYPSLGCLTCKTRRVKCDETHPICRQCQRGLRDCAYDDGISEDHTRKFLSENAFATGDRKRRPRKSKTGVTVLSISDNAPSKRPAKETSGKTLTRPGAAHSSDPPASSLITRGQASTLTWRLKLPVEAHALAHFAVKYTASPSNFPEIIDGHSRYVLPLFAGAPDDSSLKFTVTACSLASFGSDVGDPATLVKADRVYQNALASTKQALLSPQQLISDDLLITVMALSHYEGMMHKTGDLLPAISNGPGHGYRQVRSWSHHEGAKSLLKLRLAANLSDEQRGLDRTVRRGLIKTLLLREQPIPAWLAQGAAFGETGLGLAIDEATVRVSNLRYQASKVLQTSPTSMPPYRQQTRRLIDEAHTVEVFLCDVVLDLAPEWSYRTAETKASEHSYYGKKAYVYASLGHAAIWNRYRALRLLVNDTLLRACKQLNATGEQVAPMLEASAEAKIQALLKDICASVPQYFGHVATDPASVDSSDGETEKGEPENALSVNLLTFSLLIALGTTSVSDGQKRWLKERLAEVGRIANKQALRAVATRT